MSRMTGGHPLRVGAGDRRSVLLAADAGDHVPARDARCSTIALPIPRAAPVTRTDGIAVNLVVGRRGRSEPERMAALAATSAATRAITGATVNRDIVAPTTAPAHIVSTTENRSFSRSPVTACQPAVHADADDRRRQHRGAELLDAELAGRRILASERHRQAGDQDQLRVVVVVEHTRARQDRQRQQNNAFHAERDCHPAAGVVLEVAGEPAADHRLRPGSSRTRRRRPSCRRR